MKTRRQIGVLAAGLVVLLFLSPVCAGASSQNDSATPTLVEVYWKSSRSVVVPGITNLIVLDPDITRAETGNDTVRFFGLERGETVVLGYIGGQPLSIRVRVIERPPVPISPSLLRRQAEMVQGTVGSTVQVSRTDGNDTLAVVNGLSWSQPMAKDGRLDFMSQVEDNDYAGSHAFNVRQASIFFHSPNLDVHGMDFNVSLTGDGSQHFLSPFSYTDWIQLRGAGVTYRAGDNQYTVYAGTTIPYYFLTLGATRDIAGFSYQRRQSAKVSLFANTSYINAPIDFLLVNPQRRNNVMQTAGITFLPNKNWSTQLVGGISNHGGMGRAEFAYSNRRLAVYGSGTMSSVLFPLNQIESLLGGTSNFKAGWTFKSSDRLTEFMSYQHTITKPFGGIVREGSSDYLSPGVTAWLNKKQEFTANYAYSRNSGGLANDSSTGNRVDLNWHTLFTPQLSNSVQVTVGSLQDPLQLNSEDEFMFRDSFSFPVKGGSLVATFEHDRTNPSLVQKLNQELVLLSPGLQALFLADPVSFVNSGNLPPEVRAILNAQQPLDTAVSLTGQLRLGDKLMLNPSASMARISNGVRESWTPFFGYGVVYRVRPSFQLTSGLNTLWVLENSAGTVQRTTVFSFGFTKYFRAMPLTFSPTHRGRIIEGRVFRDNKVNGVYSAGDNGLPGIMVRLEDGQVAITDELGRYKFSDVPQGLHDVVLDLAQFREPVRMTTRNQLSVDLIRDHIAIADFGIVNFARLTGTVYNDLRFDGSRQVDAKGLPEVHLILEDGRNRRVITTNGTGDYDVEDLPPGDYKLTVDNASLPANYLLAKESFNLHVSPVSSVALDIPVRALRSIAGRVFLKVSAETPGAIAPQNSAADYKLVPMADIQVTAGSSVVKTDAYGNFLLRDLPAGDLTVTLVPLRPLPEGMKVPAGAVHMPAEPIQVQGATIVISNPDLVPYLVGKSAAQVRDDALKLQSQGAQPATPAPAADPSTKPATAMQPGNTERVKPAGGGTP